MANCNLFNTFKWEAITLLSPKRSDELRLHGRCWPWLSQVEWLQFNEKWMIMFKSSNYVRIKSSHRKILMDTNINYQEVPHIPSQKLVFAEECYCVVVHFCWELPHKWVILRPYCKTYCKYMEKVQRIIWLRLGSSCSREQESGKWEWEGGKEGGRERCTPAWWVWTHSRCTRGFTTAKFLLFHTSFFHPQIPHGCFIKVNGEKKYSSVACQSHFVLPLRHLQCLLKGCRDLLLIWKEDSRFDWISH